MGHKEIRAQNGLTDVSEEELVVEVTVPELESNTPGAISLDS
jgi:hypothetical protein